MKALRIQDWSGDPLLLQERSSDAPTQVIAEIKTATDWIGLDIQQAIAIRDWLTQNIERHSS